MSDVPIDADEALAAELAAHLAESDVPPDATIDRAIDLFGWRSPGATIASIGLERDLAAVRDTGPGVTTQRFEIGGLVVLVRPTGNDLSGEVEPIPDGGTVALIPASGDERTVDIERGGHFFVGDVRRGIHRIRVNARGDEVLTDWFLFVPVESS